MRISDWSSDVCSSDLIVPRSGSESRVISGDHGCGERVPRGASHRGAGAGGCPRWLGGGAGGGGAEALSPSFDVAQDEGGEGVGGGCLGRLLGGCRSGARDR